VLSEISGDVARTHGERLPGDAMRALESAAVTIEDVELLAVAAGPGSFTGLRVGIAAMQGLAMALDRRIVAVSALDALAVAGANGRACVATWIDAQRGEVFAALYDETGTRAVRDPTARSPLHTLDAWSDAIVDSMRFIGDGAARYADVIRSRLGAEVDILTGPPLAGIIGQIAGKFPERALLPHAVVPIYIRKPDAELAREKARG
jgi:tRNA threonylcarbamoyladenosine biosynthesis protein TsaB